MQKRVVGLALVLVSLLIISTVMVSAFSFSHFFDKFIGKNTVTGKVTSSITCNSEQFGGNGMCSGTLSNCTNKIDQVAAVGINISLVERIDIIEQGCYVPSSSVPWGGSIYQCPANSGYDVCFRNGNDGNANYVYLGIILYKHNCTDSDVDSTHQDGLNYYVKGGVTVCNSGVNSGGCGFAEDRCTTNSNLRELYCVNTTGSYFTDYNCPNGCSNGACITQSVNDSIYAHVYSAVTQKLDSSDSDFDLNNNEGVSIGDQLALRNFYYGDVSYRQANIIVLNKLLSAINNRLNVASTNANYLAGLDLNDDGVITSTDYNLLKSNFGQGLLFSTEINRCGELSSSAKAKVEQGRNLSRYYGKTFATSEGDRVKKNDYVVIYSPQNTDKMRVLRVANIPGNNSVNDKVMLTDALTGETFDFTTGTGQTASTNIDGSTYYLFANNYVLNDLDRYIILTWGTGSSYGNVGSEKDSLNCTASTSTCTDSDGGLNYYVLGSTTSCPTNHSESCIGFDDVCSDTSLLREGFCEGGSVSDKSYACPNGCSNGACVQPYGCKNLTGIITLTPGEDTSITILDKIYHISLVSVLPDAYVKIDYNISTLGGIYEIRSRTIRVGQVAQIDDNVYIEVTSAYLSGYVGDLPTKASFLFHYNCGNTNQVCSDLINAVKNPTTTDDRRLSWNDSYSGYDYVNGERENYTTYYAGWYWNAPDYQKDQINYYYADYQIQVFDNKNINLSEYTSWNENNPTCKLTNYWINEKENNYYICNWDVFNNQQDITNNQGNNREIFWYNNNVVVRMNLYYGTELIDAQVTKLATLKINELLNSLQNNQGKYIDWNNFNIDYPASNEIYNTFQMCGSDIFFNWSTSQGDWSCKTEPVICPEHGYQTRICTRYNFELQKDEVQENRMSCSPGICSGCYEPRWYGATKGDNTCIPYGFRFSHQTGEHFELVERNENVSLGEYQSDQGYGLVINSANEAILTIMTDYELQTIENFTLIPGQSVDITQKSGSESQTIRLGVIAIHPASTDAESHYVPGYVDLTVTYTENQRIVDSFNAYCDIDGQIKQQKTKDYNGNWAGCQNNYECSSNICSDGECIELKGIANEANSFKAFFVRLVCRIGNIGDSAGYNSCLSDFGVSDAGNF